MESINTFFVLDKDHNVVPAKDVHEWAEFFEKFSKRIVKQDHIDEYFISTVFLGLDMGVFAPDGRPLVFETMIFKGTARSHEEEYQDRYFTWDEALAGHARAMNYVREKSHVSNS